jgi:hypothetical protein
VVDNGGSSWVKYGLCQIVLWNPLGNRGCSFGDEPNVLGGVVAEVLEVTGSRVYVSKKKEGVNKIWLNQML